MSTPAQAQSPGAAGGRDGRPEPFTSRLQRFVWDRRAQSWDHGGVLGLEKIINAVLDAAEVGEGAAAVDLGCGTGQLSLPLAQRGARVTAVDISANMIDLLNQKARAAGVPNVTGMVSTVEQLDLPAGSVDLVVSNYALHHLHDRDKERAVAAAYRWLKPGGRLVIGDMMFGRGGTARDRAIIGSKVTTMVKRGPGGWWRLAKNVGRFTLRFQERPVSIETWKSYYARAGFRDIVAVPVVAEAAVVAGTKPL
jgi:ubiquinone/menaquinone biosynthesis C-methylase UbiE